MNHIHPPDGGSAPPCTDKKKQTAESPLSCSPHFSHCGNAFHISTNKKTGAPAVYCERTPHFSRGHPLLCCESYHICPPKATTRDLLRRFSEIFLKILLFFWQVKPTDISIHRSAKAILLPLQRSKFRRYWIYLPLPCKPHLRKI